MKHLFIFLVLFLLIFTGCSKKDIDLNNKRMCQEGCLLKNLSFSNFEVFENNQTDVLKCDCQFYLEVNNG